MAVVPGAAYKRRTQTIIPKNYTATVTKIINDLSYEAYASGNEVYNEWLKSEICVLGVEQAHEVERALIALSK